MVPEPLSELVDRLHREREQADEAYNAALTALDKSLHPPADMPDPPPPYDDSRLETINQAWDTLPAGAPATDGSLKGKLRAFIWRIVGPSLEGQRTFNAALVDHLNRNVAAHREAEKSIATTIEVLRQHNQHLAVFETHLIHYLQTITGYVDTRNRDVGGRLSIINAGFSAVTSDWMKRWESINAWEQRIEARNAPLVRAYDELTDRATLAQQSALMLKRQVETLLSTWPADTPTDGGSAHPAPPAVDLDAFKYVGFEDRFRGSQAEIRQRLIDYVPMFASASPVLDIGCGRGEFLDLLRAAGIDARGIDLNETMVVVCHERGLSAERADALGYLQSLPDESLGGLIAVQVVEHLEPAYLMRVLDAAFHKLRPGAPMVLETLNPACWVAFFESYIRDVTHRWPLHPDTLKYLVQASGFAKVDVQFRAPVSFADKLPTVPRPVPREGVHIDPTLLDTIDVVNAHAERINARLFTFLDYCIVATR